MVKNPTSKRKYTAEFKADVLRLVTNGEPILSVARKMGISDSLIHAWRAAEKKKKGPLNSSPPQQISSLEQEIESLRKQLKQTEMEREILKKAVSIFSRMT